MPTWAALFVQSQQPFVVGSHSAVNVCPPPALAGQFVWSLSFVPSCCPCELSSLGVCCGVLSPWPLVAPYPSVVSRLGFFLWRLFRLGFEGCGPGFGSSLLFFCFGGGGGGLSFPCPCCFRLAFTTFVVRVPWVFLDFLLGFFHLAFQCLLVVRGG